MNPSEMPPNPSAQIVQLTERLHSRGRGSDNTGEPPGGQMLEARVARLEDDMREVRSDLKALRSDVSELKGRVAMLPGYGGIALIVGLMVGLSTAAQIAAKFIQ